MGHESGQIKFAVRRGDIEPSGAYFALPGSSTYFDPLGAGAKCYDLAGVGLLDCRKERDAAARLFERTQTLCEAGEWATDRGRELLADALVDIAGGDAFIGYMLADETPMAAAVKELGFGGLLIWENDDWASPSSVFVWDLSTVRELEPAERDAYLREHYPELMPESDDNEDSPRIKP